MFQEGVNTYMVKFNRDLSDERLSNIEKFIHDAEKGDSDERKFQQKELWKALAMYGLNLNDVREILEHFKIPFGKLPTIKELSAMLIPDSEEDKDAYQTTDIKDVFVPTDKVDRPVIKEGETPFEKKEIIERGRMLIDFLKKNGIEVKPYHILKGQNTPEMMRKESYVLFIVPSIDSMILVCDEEDNATFVIRDLPVDPKQYYSLTKDELKSHPHVAKEIRWSNQEKWETQILDALTDPRTSFDKPRKEETKTEGWTPEQWQTEIRKRYTAEQWANLKTKERSEKIYDKTLLIISRIFNVNGTLVDNIVPHLEFGTKIWPEDEEMRKRYEDEQRKAAEKDENRRPTEGWTTEELKKGIAEEAQRKYTPEQWTNVNQVKQDMQILGRGLTSIAGIFGIKGNIHSSNLSFLELGTKIWPDNNMLKKLYEVESWTADDWRTEMQRRYTPELWLKPGMQLLKTRKFLKRGLTNLATIFGVEGNVHGKRKVFLELGLKIWPNNEILKKMYEIEDWGQEEWKTELRKRYTPDILISKSKREKDNLEVYDRKLAAIGAIFGLQGSPLKTIYLLELCTLIWPEDSVVKRKYQIETWKEDDWRLEMQRKYTPEKWLLIKHKEEAGNIFIEGHGLVFISRKFGLSGDPIKSRKNFYELGLKIWPNNPDISAAIQKLENK